MDTSIGTKSLEQDPVTLDIRPMSGYIGAEIHGIDLAKVPDESTVQAIRSALLKWKVVFFRDQSINHAQHVAFTELFGKATRGHPHEPKGSEGFPQIFELDSRKKKKYGKKYTDKKNPVDSSWHSDITPLVNPPWGSILRAEQVPPYGGDTQWTNLEAAYQGLPEPLRDLADGLRVKHSFGDVKKTGNDDSDFGKSVLANPLVTLHPAVRVHPETGARALFVSPGFTEHDSEVSGLSKRQSQAILGLFWEQIMLPKYTVRFRWEPGSVAFWDNRNTCHLAPSDLVDTGFPRVMYRTTLEGQIPVGPDGRQSESLQGEPFLGF